MPELQEQLDELKHKVYVFERHDHGIAGGENLRTDLMNIDDADVTMSDVTTGNVTSTAHGFAPKSPADATKFLNGAATPAYALVKDSDLSTSAVTDNDVTIAKHGFCPIAPNDVTRFLRGDTTWGVPAGAGLSLTKGVIDDNSDVAMGSNTDTVVTHGLGKTPIKVTISARISAIGKPLQLAGLIKSVKPLLFTIRHQATQY